MEDLLKGLITVPVQQTQLLLERHSHTAAKCHGQRSAVRAAGEAES